MIRQPYWNIESGWLIDLLAAPALILLAYGLYRRFKVLRGGGAGSSMAGLIRPVLSRRGIAAALKALAGSRLYSDPLAGPAHGLLLWGMVVLALGTAMVLLNVVFGLPVFSGRFNTWFMAFGLDLAGLAALAGLLVLLGLRLAGRERLRAVAPAKGMVWLELVLALVLISGFAVEGLRLEINGPESGAFVGNLLASVFQNGLPAGAWHRVLWWVHGLAALSLIAWLPFSPLKHLIFGPLKAAQGRTRLGLGLPPLDFDQLMAESDNDEQDLPPLGAEKPGDLVPANLLDGLACVLCGRCHQVCPAVLSDKSLSPKAAPVALSLALDQGNLTGPLSEALDWQRIYECRTCGACRQACPVYVDPLETIIHHRRHLAMELSQLPDTMAQALRSLEARGHPFFGAGSGPRDWLAGLKAPRFESGKTEYLLWPGCAVVFEERAQKAGRALVEILNRIGLNYGLLAEHHCTGDPARVMGNEFLFNELASANIEELQGLGVKKMITLCAHCYSSLAVDYRDLGGEFEVIPHVELLARILEAGLLKLKAVAGGEEKLTFHDPCYLGRLNGIFESPRKALRKLGSFREMARHREQSLCCGGGGGNYWAEEEGLRINRLRAGQGLDTGANKIATACPFCLLMLTDGVKSQTEDRVVFDLAELIAERLV